MKDNEMEYLKDVMDAARGSGKISEWEEGFMASTEERIEKYGQNTHMSPKQWAVIEKIAEKVGVDKDDYVS